jgi:uncharacterized protein
MHGDADRVIPYSQGRALFEAAPDPKAFVSFPGSGHSTLLEDGGIVHVRALLAGLEAGDAARILAEKAQ